MNMATRTSLARHPSVAEALEFGITNLKRDATVVAYFWGDRINVAVHDFWLEIKAIGQKAMEKHERDLCHKILQQYESKSRETSHMFEAEKRRSRQFAEQEIQLKHERYIKTLQAEFEHKLQSTVVEVVAKSTKTMQNAIVRERVEVTRMMLRKLRSEISYIISSIYKSFDDNLRVQKQNMVADFNEIIRREHTKTDHKIREMERAKDEALRIQSHEMEMKNFVDITCVLCLERMRSSSEKHALHLSFEKQIQTLKTLLTEAKGTVDLMKNETVAKKIDEKSLEPKLLEVVREFQKFINFSFRAVPGQAEFLLSLGSLLTLEIDDNLREQSITEKQESESLHTEKNSQFEIVESIDSSGDKWIPMQLIPDMKISNFFF